MDANQPNGLYLLRTYSICKNGEVSLWVEYREDENRKVYLRNHGNLKSKILKMKLM